MALKLRLARLGRKKTPIYAIVVADSRAPRDGNYIEKVGNYDPRQPKDSAARIVMNNERVTHWLSVGAQPTERVAVMLGKIGLAPAPAKKNNPKKAVPKAKAQERAKERAEKVAAAAEAAAAPAETPAAE